MARQKLKTRVFIELNGKSELWYEVGENGTVVWHLPKDLGKKLKAQMLNNVGSNMSRYIMANSSSSLWGT